MRDPGTATVATLAAHWSLSKATTRLVIAAGGLEDVGTGWPRYRWRDVWRLEGEAHVPTHLWATFKAPLLDPAELEGRDPEGRSARTLRRHKADGRLPLIRLRPTVTRVRACVLGEVGHG